MELFNTTENNNALPFILPNEEGYSFKFDKTLNGFFITIPNGELFYSENFFDKKISDKCIEYFLENDTNNWKTSNWRELEKEQLSQVRFKNIDWRHDKLNMYGKEVFLPRYTAWYGDNDKPYTYSGLTLQPNAWNKGLLFIKDKVDKVAKVQFNSVLMNWYRDGEDYMGWHKDEEKELGKNPVIGSVNFGATRRFLLRRIDDHTKKFELPLNDGSFLLMRGQIQHFWQHSVPKELAIRELRFNLTFRIITN